MAKRQQKQEPTEKVELTKTPVSLDQRLVTGRSISIEKIRQAAKIAVSEYSADPDKYLAKIRRGNVLVVQELVDRQDYTIEQVTQAYRQDILDGQYDEALTTTYQQQKAKRKQ